LRMYCLWATEAAVRAGSTVQAGSMPTT